MDVKMKKLLILATLVVALTACINDGKYEVRDDMVVYSYWTFSFGTLYDTLPGADPATFEVIKNWLGHDSERVYFKAQLVPGADVESLKAKRYPLFRDKNDYYYMNVPLHVADVESFRTLKWFEDDFWAVDSRYAYYDTTRIDGADVSSFKVDARMAVALDKAQVYYFGRVIPMADPATFKVIDNSAYSRDKSHIWCGDDLLVDADYDSFEVDDIDRAHDKYGSFKWERRDTVETEE